MLCTRHWIQRSPSLHAALVSVGLAAAGLLGPAGALAAEGEHHPFGPHQAARLFKRKCAGCHTVPDPARKTDLAWLDQVNRTS